MQIVIIHGSNDNYGASKVLLDEVQVLESLGHDVLILVPTEGPLREKISSRNLQAIIEIDPKLLIIRRSRIRDLLHFPRTRKKFSNFDIVVLWTLATMAYVPFLKLARIPYYLSVHEILRPGLELKIISRILLAARTKCEFCSYAAQESLSNYGDFNSNSVVTYPIFEAKPSNISPNFLSPRTFAVVGRINGQKGHLEAIRAFQDSSIRKMDIELLLIGSPFKGQEGYFEQVLLEASSDSRIRIFGELSQVDFQSLKITALLSFPKSPEAFGLVPIEAWLQGVRTYGYNLGGSKEVLKLVDGKVIENSGSVVDDILAAIQVHLKESAFERVSLEETLQPLSAGARRASVVKLLNALETQNK